VATAVQSDADTLLAGLARAVGPDNVLTQEADRRFYSTDVYNHVELPAAVVRPGSVEELQAVVRAAAEAGAPVVVRGGGASYTDGYVHAKPGGVTIDTSRLIRIEIDEVNAYVTVEAGVTWAELHAALAAKGLRTPFWGPFSGLAATVGGSASQNAISHGTGAHGSSAENILSFDIVTGTGELLRTGSAGSKVGIPHFRHYGPDLTGLFCGDCGALGVKARITLPLIRRREAFEAASFSFSSFEAMHAAMRAIAIEGVDDENFGLDAALQQGQIGRNEGVAAKAEIAKKVLKSATSIASGVKSLARMAAAGDRALRQASYAVHYIADGVDAAEARAKIAVIKRLAAAHGEEIPNTVPTVVRGMPFAPLTNTLGPKGERWVPMHGLFAHDRAVPFHEALQRFWDERRAEMDRFGIYTGAMFMSVRSTAFVYEPTFYWPDERSAFHERMVPADHLATIASYPESPEARALVHRLKHDVAELMAEHGAAHLQIGKFYPYLDGRNPAAIALVRALKVELDPRSILNPGALGL
jgi:FAD/FMN-containing dehydrogenase